LALSFMQSSSAIIPAPETSAGAEISVPARRKKKGVSSANAIARSRSSSSRSCVNTPATTSPAT
jgi:hypothetical protein